MICPKCGNEVDDKKQFCPKCGANIRSMFSRLWDLEYERTKKQAFGYFLFHGLIVLLLEGVLGLVWIACRNLFGISNDLIIKFFMGTTFALPVLYYLNLSILTLIQKKIYKNTAGILLAVFSPIIGAISTACLTTFASENDSENKSENKGKTIGLILGIPFIISVVIAFIIMIAGISSQTKLYTQALEAYNKQDYYTAQKKIEKLPYDADPDYNVLRSKINAAILVKAGDAELEAKHYKNAITKYEEAQSEYNSDEVAQKINNAKKLMKQKIKTLENGFVSSYSNSRKWFYDRANIAYVEDNCIYYVDFNKILTMLYIGKSTDGDQWLRFRIVYSGPEIDWHEMVFDADGDRQSFVLSDSDINRKLPYWDEEEDALEVGDVKYNDYETTINKIINSKKATVTLKGNGTSVKKVISDSEKDAMRRIVDYYWLTHK